MRNSIIWLVANFICCALIYGAGAFIEFDFNVENWTPVTRGVAVVAMLAYLAASFASVFGNADPE